MRLSSAHAATSCTRLAMLVLAGVVQISAADTGAAQRLAGRVLLVQNADSPVSCAVADDYAAKRGIVAANRLAIHCPDAALFAERETIAFADYVNAVRTPIASYLALADHAGIDFIVLTKGVPIRIRGAESGNRSDGGPALDSCLAALGYEGRADAEKYRFVFDEARGWAWANRYWNATGAFSHATYGGYLVTRLDGYTEADAKALVARALKAESHLAGGAILLDLQPEFGLGDPASQPGPLPPAKDIASESAWSEYNADMAHAAQLLNQRGIACELESTPRFAGERHDLLGYFSWGSNDAHFSAAAYLSLTFAPGAVCDTAVSTSARTFLATSGGQSLITDLIAHGVTGVKGYVNEPLLQACASPTILCARYTAGATLAESFYAASRFLGWEDIVVGDPLCRPYAKR